MALTPAQFREHHPTSLVDAALQRLIDAAEGAITARFGAIASFSDRRRGGSLLLFLSRPAASISSVTERYGDPLGVTDVLLSANDYTLLPGGLTLRREYTGAHPADRWTDDVVVVFVPADDSAQRTRVTIALVQLDISHNPGLSSEQIGDWSASYADNSAMNYGLEREAILATLWTGVGFA